MHLLEFPIVCIVLSADALIEILNFESREMVISVICRCDCCFGMSGMCLLHLHIAHGFFTYPPAGRFYMQTLITASTSIGQP